MSKSANEMLDRLRDTRDERMAVLDDDNAVENHKLGQQLDRAAKELPERYQLVIEIERGYGGAEMLDPWDNVIGQTDGDGSFAGQIEALIDQAIQHYEDSE